MRHANKEKSKTIIIKTQMSFQTSETLMRCMQNHMITDTDIHDML